MPKHDTISFLTRSDRFQNWKRKHRAFPHTQRIDAFWLTPLNTSEMNCLIGLIPLIYSNLNYFLCIVNRSTFKWNKSNKMKCAIIQANKFSFFNMHRLQTVTFLESFANVSQHLATWAAHSEPEGLNMAHFQKRLKKHTNCIRNSDGDRHFSSKLCIKTAQAAKGSCASSWEFTHHRQKRLSSQLSTTTNRCFSILTFVSQLCLKAQATSVYLRQLNQTAVRLCWTKVFGDWCLDKTRQLFWLMIRQLYSCQSGEWPQILLPHSKRKWRTYVFEGKGTFSFSNRVHVGWCLSRLGKHRSFYH